MLRMEISDTEHLVKAVVPIEVMQLFGAGRQTYLGLQGSFISIRQCTLALHGRNSPKTYGFNSLMTGCITLLKK